MNTIIVIFLIIIFVFIIVAPILFFGCSILFIAGVNFLAYLNAHSPDQFFSLIGPCMIPLGLIFLFLGPAGLLLLPVSIFFRRK